MRIICFQVFLNCRRLSRSFCSHILCSIEILCPLFLLLLADEWGLTHKVHAVSTLVVAPTVEDLGIHEHTGPLGGGEGGGGGTLGRGVCDETLVLHGLAAAAPHPLPLVPVVDAADPPVHLGDVLVVEVRPKSRVFPGRVYHRQLTVAGTALEVSPLPRTHVLRDVVAPISKTHEVCRTNVVVG